MVINLFEKTYNLYRCMNSFEVPIIDWSKVQHHFLSHLITLIYADILNIWSTHLSSKFQSLI